MRTAVGFRVARLALLTQIDDADGGERTGADALRQLKQLPGAGSGPGPAFEGRGGGAQQADGAGAAAADDGHIAGVIAR